jgi:mannitol/fructose-specific phosphotransferase system IIA component (Ntr-type)
MIQKQAGDHMHPVVNHMIQLQDLMLARDEQRAAGHALHLEQLEGSINGLCQDLSDPFRTQYSKLSQRDRNAIVRIVDNSCSACRMALPISLVQLVRMAKEVYACPACARYLYVPEAPVRNTARGPKRFEVQKPGISRFSSPTLMIPNLASSDKDGIIHEFAECLCANGFVDKKEALIEHALRREALLSTAVDHGLAFPHVRGVEGGGLTLAVGVHKKGVHFDGPKGRVSKLFFFMVIPTAASSFYLKLLAGLTETFMVKEARDALFEAESPEQLWKALIKLTKKSIK